MESVVLVLAVAVIALAVYAVARGLDVRLALLAAALLLGALAKDLPAIMRKFLETFSDEKFIVPICSAMGFAYVLKHTGCDTHLVRLLVVPVRKVRWLMIPGVVLVGFIVNIPVISQTSTAVCLGTVVVPLLRAAGFSPVTIGATLLLGASVGGELFNPGAPELLTVYKLTNTTPQELSSTYLLRPVLVTLAVSGLVFWFLTNRRERKATHQVVSELPTNDEPLNVFKALVPLVPLVLLFLSGPPFRVLQIPMFWLVEGNNDKIYGSRLIGLAMLLGVGVAALATPRKSGGCMKAFFDGAGYGYANIISLIVIANCFGEGIKIVGLTKVLGGWIEQEPGLLTPLAGFVPMAFAFVCGSGMASTQSLYEFFFHATVGGDGKNLTVEQTHQANEIGAMVGLGSAVGRTLSPVSAVTLMCCKLTDTKPMQLVKAVAVPLLLGLTATVVLRMLRVI